VCKKKLHTGIVVGVVRLHTGVFCAALLCLISARFQCVKRGQCVNVEFWPLVGVVGSFWRSLTLVQILYLYVGISSKRFK
jgi:hypothetical protein